MSTITKCLCLLVLCISNVYAFHAESPSKTLRWLDAKTSFFQDKIIANISLPGAKRGTVVAARQANSGPDYQYHWVRDAGLTMIALVDIYQETTDEARKHQLRGVLFDYLDFSTYIQNVPKLADLGEPKFYLDGRAYNEPWGRPQNDGPALRAISLIHWANVLLTEHDEETVREKLYNDHLPATSPIKKDLEYISHHWKEPSYDLWEETKGTHFYTLMVIRRALLEGATLAITLNDANAARWYRSQAKQIELELDHFWDDKKGYLTATINREDGIDYKVSNLDTAVILGLLHGGMHDDFLAWDNPKVIATLVRLTAVFKEAYPINKLPVAGVAIGRYPEDRYSGDTFDGGNPWPICTLAVAEAWYEYADLLRQRNVSTRDTINMANKFIERVRYHAYKDGSMDEQIDRNTGFMTSARDLTWNYAALLTVRGVAIRATALPLDKTN